MAVARRPRTRSRRAQDDQPGARTTRRRRRRRSPDEITPIELHYVRSNFAVPTHDGSLEIGGAVENPTTLTLDDLRAAAGGRACRHARMRRQRTSGDAAAADRRALGRLRRLDRPLDGRPPARRPRAGAAGGGRRRGSLRRRRPRPVPPRARPAGHQPRRPGLRAFARRSRTQPIRRRRS